VTDPLKSFLRVVERRLGWKMHWHNDDADLVTAVTNAEYPPYFFCMKDRHLLPLDFLVAVSANGGYLYEGLQTDALSLFRMLTTTQAWTVSCTEDQTEEAEAQLRRLWQEVGLREEAHAAPELVDPPKRQNDDIGGGFGATSFGDDDSKWDDVSDDESSSDSDAEADAKKDDSKVEGAAPDTTVDDSKPDAKQSKAE
jgi:hypothetical protein